jgi:hypothetical protein
MQANAQTIDDDFSPDPPTPAECELQECVSMIVFDLEQAANGYQPAERLARALRELAAERRKGTISEGMRRRLTAAILRLHAITDLVLPPDIDRLDIAMGFSAAIVQMRLLGVDPRTARGRQTRILLRHGGFRAHPSRRCECVRPSRRDQGPLDRLPAYPGLRRILFGSGYGRDFALIGSRSAERAWRLNRGKFLRSI